MKLKYNSTFVKTIQVQGFLLNAIKKIIWKKSETSLFACHYFIADLCLEDSGNSKANASLHCKNDDHLVG